MGESTLSDCSCRFWSPYFGCFRINNMKWVIEKVSFHPVFAISGY